MEATDSRPPRKRARQSEDDEDSGSNHEPSASATPLTRSPDYWFDDGSIILHAESTQFRVHRSMLSRHSSVFRDMFGIPQPSHGEPQVEGCLVVHVSDFAADIALMLSSLYDRKRAKDRLPLSFALVSAMLRLGKKYDIEYQYDDARDVLELEFPSTLAEWRSKRSTIGKYIKREEGFIYDIITLAFETDTLSILPSAYLTLAGRCGDTDAIFKGFERRDGSLAKIPLEAQIACVIGRDKMLTTSPLLIYKWLPIPAGDPPGIEPPSNQCLTPAMCVDACRACGLELFENPLDTFYCLNGPEELESFDGFCANCGDIVSTSQEIACRELWQDLPRLFGLKSWKDILR